MYANRRILVAIATLGFLFSCGGAMFHAPSILPVSDMGRSHLAERSGGAIIATTYGQPAVRLGDCADVYGVPTGKTCIPGAPSLSI